MLAPTSTMPTMKLLVDTKSQRVLFAEAGEDAVDFLFALLSTPAVGDGGCAGGSILNLYIGAAAKKLAGVASSGGNGGHEAPAAAAAAPPPPAPAAMFTVMDDLKIAPMSSVCAIARLSSLGVEDIRALQEKTVQLGYAEGLEMLMVSLQSKAVLTGVFIGKKKSPKYGVLSKRGAAKLFFGIFALQVICDIVRLVNEGFRG